MTNAILIIVGILVVIWIVRFLFKSIKLVITVVVVLVLAAVVVHFAKPELIDEYVGKETHDEITNMVNEKMDEGEEMLRAKLDETKNDVVDSANDKVEEVLN